MNSVEYVVARITSPTLASRVLRGSPLAGHVPVVHRRAAEAAPREQRVAGDRTDALPAEALVQACTVAVRDGVEHEQRLPAFARRGFGRAQQARAEAPTASAPVHQHLRQ